MNNPPVNRGLRHLLLCCCAIGLVWMVLLPQLASQPAMQARLEWLEKRKIDPSAMFYTELEAMEPILKELNSRQRQQQASSDR